jgi:transposase
MADSHDKRRQRILDAYAQSGSIRATRRATGHSIGLIRKVLRGQDRPKPPSSVAPRPSKLDPFRVVLRRLVVEDGLSAILAIEELRALGFEGGYSIVKQAVRELRPSPARRPTTRIEHKPGAEGQVDWSPYRVLLGGQRAEVHAFSLVLPFSRWMFVRFAMDEQLETLVGLHDQAFSLLGGVPHVMSYDNMTTVGRHIGPNDIWLNPRFEPYAGEYGFGIKLITPYKPNEHASVERPFHYVENNCLKRRRSRFEDLEDLNRHARWWCDEVANVRIHGSTRQRPIDRFRAERSYLLPLPGERPEAFHTLARKVQTDYCVAVDTNRYSVEPRHVGRPATVLLYAERLDILVDGQLVATHARSKGSYERHVLVEHEEAFMRHTPSRRLLEQAFVRLGPGAEAFYQGLRAQRGQGAGHHIKRLLVLADRHGNGAVIAAMNHAARFGAYSADAVTRVLAGAGLARKATATPTGEVPMPPERVRSWLEGLDVEQRDLADYDDLIDGAEAGDDDDDEDE